MGIIVQKFGGSSVANIERLNQVAGHIITEVEKGNKVVVVGGGLTGVAAAVSAAREGLTVLLIEKSNILKVSFLTFLSLNSS